MNKIITHETVRSFACVNDKVCKQPIRGHCKLTYAANDKRLRLALDYVGGAK